MISTNDLISPVYEAVVIDSLDRIGPGKRKNNRMEGGSSSAIGNAGLMFWVFVSLFGFGFVSISDSSGFCSFIFMATFPVRTP